MIYGPCGGVRPDGDCEVGGRPCPFVGQSTVAWTDGDRARLDRPAAPDVAASALLDTARRRPVVLTDLTGAPFDLDSVRATVAAVRGSCDAVLVGEHQNRPDFPPTMLAAEILGAEARPWMTLACRDRNRVVLEQELLGLRQVGADGVLCVTGDARGQGVRPDASQVFDLDGTRLAALARDCGLPAAVAESPLAPPAELRPLRVATKQQAGAAVCVLNHVAHPVAAAGFVAAARAAGVVLPFVAAVAVYTDERSAAVLDRFPGLSLDPRAVGAVLTAADPVAAGIATAVREATELLAIDGVVGINISGLGSVRSVRDGAAVKAEVGRQVLDGSRP